MAHIDLHSCDKPYVKLNDRILWFDGDNTCKPARILQLAKKGFNLKGIHVTEQTADIRQYNRLVSNEDQIVVKTELRLLNDNYTIPAEYAELDVERFITKKLVRECKSLTEKERRIRVQRVLLELELVDRFNLEDMLRLLIFVVDTMERTNTVWGVGRGSSVSSYILYLIGVHDVDSVLYDLEPEEFFHD